MVIQDTEVCVFLKVREGNLFIWFEYISGSQRLNHRDIHFDDDLGECKYSLDKKCKIIPSPYLYSGTDIYDSGKYISDGSYSTDTVDKQPGVYLLLSVLKEDEGYE